MRAGVDRYRVAWLANDADAVLAEFEDEGVLMPPGKGPVVGKEAIRAYWWPPQSVTTITGFDMVIDEVAGYGDLAVVRGHDRVEWLDAEHQRAESWSRFVTELVRSPGGRWRIRGQSWVTAERPGR